MKKRFPILLIPILLALAAQSQIVISGKVLSADNSPLPGATVLLKGTHTAVQTDEHGQFTIKVPDKGAILVFSYISAEKKEIVAGSFIGVVILGYNPHSLSDIAVIGYGSIRKKDFTGSVGIAPLSDMLKAPVSSFDQAMAGRFTGVQVTSGDGQPGSPINIVIRGPNSVSQANSPLYVIDGFTMENPNNNSINPDDIESITILKDASATAIYGARGSNGVIILSTKKGKAGDPVISYNTYSGIQKDTKQIPLMGPADYVKYQMDYNPNTSPLLPGGLITPYWLYFGGNTSASYYSDSAQFIDWQRAILQTAPLSNNSLSISGGNAQTRYAISGNIFNQSGIIVHSGFTRYQGRVVLDQTIRTKLKVGINVNYSYINQSGMPLAQSNSSATNNIMYSVWGFRPLNPSPASEAALGLANLNSTETLTDPTVSSTNDYRFNPYVNLMNLVRNNITKDLITNAYLDYNLCPHIALHVTGGINTRTLVNQSFNPSNTSYGSSLISTQGMNGSVMYNEYNSWINENYLTYSNKFGAYHYLNLMAGMSTQQVNTSNYGFSAINVPNATLGINGLSQGTPLSVSTDASINRSLSFYGRANYNFKSRYLFTFTYRADGSSKFAPQNHWAYFPSMGVSWRFSQENFIHHLRWDQWMSDGKFRLSYGITGNNRVSDFSYLPTYIQTPNLADVYTFNNQPITGAIGTTIGNQDLKWETTQQWNLGMDLSLFKNRVSLTAEVYQKITSHLLLNAQIPSSSGYFSVMKNIGTVQNQGLELNLSTTNIQSAHFIWTSSFNISFNSNKVRSLSNNQESLISTISWDNNWQSTPAYITKIGMPLGLMYGYIWDGVYQYADFDRTTNGGYLLKDNISSNGNVRSNIQPGDIKYKDINGDKVVDANDQTIIGRSLPVHIGGLNNNFIFHQFDLSLFFQWSYGNDIQNANNLVFNGNALNKPGLNQYATYVNRWSPGNTHTNLFRVGGYTGSAGGYSSMTVEDGSYLRLKTISLGYTISRNSLMRTHFFKTVRVYASAQNLLTWTHYSGQDPEVNAYNSVLTGGFDYSSYPRARTYTFGINATL